MKACLDMTSAYARIRVAFGQPIGAFQAVQHQCADMLLMPESARSAVYREYLERLNYELRVIRETGFAPYFLIVWDFTRAGREEAAGRTGVDRRRVWAPALGH